MSKKIIIILILLLFSQSVFALDSTKLEFFKSFNDEYLNQYMIEATQNNHELKKASQVVEQYRQQVKISFARELPSLSVGADYLGVHIPQFDNFTLAQNAFVMPFVASYEADFLLKNRDKTKSAKKLYETAKENENAIYISLLSDVATNYINILQYDYLIELQLKNVKISKEILNRTQRKFNNGLIDLNTLNSVKQNLQKEENELITLQKQEEILLNSFAVQIGKSSTESKNIERGKLNSLEYKKQIPNEISSDVIFSRPDVLVSELQLEKAKIDIRIARKEFLPRFNITGVWAFNTIAPGAFFSWESSLAAILAGAAMDIFKGGQKIANLKMQKAKYEELFENYRQTDLNAVKEVNTALCIIKQDTLIDKNTQKQIDLESLKYNNINKKYKQGLISYLELINAESYLLDLKQYKARTKSTRLIDYITLYKAVGGVL